VLWIKALGESLEEVVTWPWPLLYRFAYLLLYGSCYRYMNIYLLIFKEITPLYLYCDFTKVSLMLLLSFLIFDLEMIPSIAFWEVSRHFWEDIYLSIALVRFFLKQSVKRKLGIAQNGFDICKWGSSMK
jgi:hypothetical protein